MEDKDLSEPVLAFPDLEEPVIIENFEKNFCSESHPRKLPVFHLFLAESMINVTEA